MLLVVTLLFLLSVAAPGFGFAQLAIVASTTWL
jgi:multisubunit Na+/H+ antiporter MnhB subunit